MLKGIEAIAAGEWGAKEIGYAVNWIAYEKESSDGIERKALATQISIR